MSRHHSRTYGHYHSQRVESSYARTLLEVQERRDRLAEQGRIHGPYFAARSFADYEEERERREPLRRQWEEDSQRRPVIPEQERRQLNREREEAEWIVEEERNARDDRFWARQRAMGERRLEEDYMDYAFVRDPGQ